MSVNFKLLVWLALVLGGVVSGSPARASILSVNRLQIDLTRQEEATNKANWSDKLGVTTSGIAFDGEPPEMYDEWLQTKPLAVGLSWRPPSAVSIRVTIEPAPKLVALNSGQKDLPDPGQLFARYSPDGRHWSSWQWVPLDKSSAPSDATVFSGVLAVPRRERAQYEQYMTEYRKLTAPKASDEKALAIWILQRDPAFFEHWLPNIGNVEFLLERDFCGGQRITKFQADIAWGVSGFP